MAYSPGISYDTESVPRAVAGVGHNVGRLIEQYAEQRQRQQEQEKNDAKMAKALRVIAPLMKGPDGTPLLTREAADNMGGAELSALLSGAVTASTLATHQAQQQRATEEINALQQSRQMQSRVAGLIGGATAGEDPMNTYKLAMLTSGGDPNAMKLADDYVRLQPKAKDGWGLKPGESVNFPGGRVGLATSENSVQLENPPAPPPGPEKASGLDEPSQKIALELFSKLQGEKAVANYTVGAQYAQTVVDLVEASKTTPTGANDIGIIFAFMKTVDPASTVREGEFATASNAGGVPDKIINQYNKILKGEKLTQDLRNEFAASARTNTSALSKQANTVRKRYTAQAKRFGIEPDFLGEEFTGLGDGQSAPPPAPAGGTSGQPGSTSGLPAGGARVPKFNPATGRIE